MTSPIPNTRNDQQNFNTTEKLSLSLFGFIVFIVLVFVYVLLAYL